MRDLAIVRPFRHRNFVLFMLGELLCRSGIWIICLIFGVLATQLKGNSPLYVGLIGFGFNLPLLLLTPFTGILADRFKRITLIKIGQVWYMLCASIMIIMLLTQPSPIYWVLIVVTLMYGAGFAWSNPALMAMVSDVVDDPKSLGGAMSIYIANNRILMFVGYSLGGFIVMYLGAVYGYVYALTVNFLAMMIYSLIKVKPKISPIKRASSLVDLKEGFHLVVTNTPILYTIILVSFTGLLAWPYIFQMPVLNKFYLHGSTSDLGLILGAGGVGGVFGGLCISLRRSSLYLTRIIVGSILLLGVSLLGLSFCHHVVLAAVNIFIVDFALSLFMTSAGTFIQQLCPEHVRGRVMGIFTMANFGMIPVGSLAFYGGLGELLGLPQMLLIGGIILVASGCIYFLNLNKLRCLARETFLTKKLIASAGELNKI